MENKFYPSAEELGVINSMVHCTEDGCTSVFASESNLTMHLVKTHKKDEKKLKKLDSSAREYYCPDNSCIYNKSKHFKALKLLKQHYLKVHKAKDFMCDNCNKGFSTQKSMNNHAEYCGVSFKCVDCSGAYSSYEGLITHARRKKHNLLEKSGYKLGVASPDASLPDLGQKLCVQKNLNGDRGLRFEQQINLDQHLDKRNLDKHLLDKPKTRFILPKGSISLQLLSTKEMSDKSNQTELVDSNKQCEMKQLHHSSSQTQTWSLHKSHSSAETQTIGDYISRKLCPTDFCNGSDENLTRKSIKTQTKPVSSTTKSCNTSFNMNEFDFFCDIQLERHSSSTQTVASVPTELMYSTTMGAAVDAMCNTISTALDTPIDTLMDSSMDVPMSTLLDPSKDATLGISIGTSMHSTMDTTLGTSIGTSIDTSTGRSMSTSMGTSMSTSMGTSMGTSMSTSTGTSMSTSIGTSMATSLNSTIGTSIGTSIDTSMDTSIDPSIHTRKDLHFDIDPLDSDNFFNCHTETQTDFIFEADLMIPDYYSHMCTQTCDDILLNDLGFNNTHTQTVFDEMLRSVESQTMMSQGSKTSILSRDMAHMETQTDIEFKQILEEINA